MTNYTLTRDDLNILITGGTGFLGSHLAKKLLNDNNIKVIARGLKTGYLTTDELKLFDFVQCDIRDKKCLAEILSSDLDLIIHCAGMIESPTHGRCPDSLVETNLNSTIYLIELMIDKDIKNLLFCSSMTVYGVENNIPVREDGVLAPIHFYGFSKKWAEEAIIGYARKGLINALILRYPGLYGYPRKTGYMYNVSRKLLKNENVNIDTRGLKFWETINIEDAGEITKKILEVWEWKKNYEVMNCSYGEEVDLVATAFKIKEIVNSESSIRVRKPLDYVSFYLDNSKLRSLIDFNYSFEESVKRFSKRYKNWLQA